MHNYGETKFKSYIFVICVKFNYLRVLKCVECKGLSQLLFVKITFFKNYVN